MGFICIVLICRDFNYCQLQFDWNGISINDFCDYAENVDDIGLTILIGISQAWWMAI